MEDIVVNVIDVAKRFKLYSSPWNRTAEWLTLGRTVRHSDFWALKNITFHLRRGESLGIIGPNGAGKTTLLKILSRALYPTLGRFEVRGRIVSLLELGTGFNPQLTGIQNIFNSGRLLGFSEEYIRRKLDAIIDFAELGDFINRPIQIYSSGMYVRLAFSLFACLDPDVYIIDEALAVGDSSFQKKCVDRINEMRQTGVTILFVSHDLWRVEAICDRAIYLDGGLVKCHGEPAVVVKQYLDDVEKRTALAAITKIAAAKPSEPEKGIEKASLLVPQFEMYAESPLRIRRLWVSDLDGNPKRMFHAGEGFGVGLEYDCKSPIKQPIFRVVFALPDERRVAVVGWHPGDDTVLQPGNNVLRWKIEGGILYPRRYVVHTSISTWDGVVYDTQYGVADLVIESGSLGPILRMTDDLAACLRYSVEHNRLG